MQHLLFGIFWMIPAHTRSGFGSQPPIGKNLGRDCGAKNHLPFTLPPSALFYPSCSLDNVRRWHRFWFSPLQGTYSPSHLSQLSIANFHSPSRSAWPDIVASTLSPMKSRIVRHRAYLIHTFKPYSTLLFHQRSNRTSSPPC